jgi:lipid-A-disaccharide synthase
MKYYIIVGEPSGDIYGAALMQALKNIDKDAHFRFWGSGEMKSVSDTCDISIEETSFMGLVEVLKNSGKIISLFSKAKNYISQYQPDMLILIDYPGFNLRMAKWAKKNKFRVAYYISPQIWAWRKYRYKAIRDYTDLFFPILPFEKKLYHELGVEFKYCGHPMTERIPSSESKKEIHKIHTVGIFPGSRLQEIRKNISVLSKFVRANPAYNFRVSVMPHIELNEYAPLLACPGIKQETNTAEMVKSCDLAIACSGTLSLELALYNVPQIIIYKTNTVSYMIARRMVKIKYISLVNLILGEGLVDELIQDKLNLNNLQAAFNTLSLNENLKRQYKGYDKIRALLGTDSCSQCVARHIHEYLKGRPT